MKKNILFLLVALFATTFVACEGDDIKPDEPTSNLSTNMLIVGTQQYAINPTISVSSEGFYLFDAHDPNNQYNIVIDIPTSYVGQTVDLTQDPTSNFDYYINFETTDLAFSL